MNRIDFAPEDEAQLASAALWGQIVAVVSILTAAAALPFEIRAASVSASALVGFGTQIVLGISLFVASRAFRRVARTDEDDHRHLLGGFRHLRRYFFVQAVLVIVAVVVMGLALSTSVLGK